MVWVLGQDLLCRVTHTLRLWVQKAAICAPPRPKGIDGLRVKAVAAGSHRHHKLERLATGITDLWQLLDDGVHQPLDTTVEHNPHAGRDVDGRGVVPEL
eukprot:SAG11_NODE_1562_length_4676_cov_2.366616_6_plen_99_part_00